MRCASVMCFLCGLRAPSLCCILWRVAGDADVGGVWQWQPPASKLNIELGSSALGWCVFVPTSCLL